MKIRRRSKTNIEAIEYICSNEVEEPKQIALCQPLQEFRQKWPAVFAGTFLDKMTGGAYRWRTLQNEACRRETPSDIFLKDGARKKLIIRDPFLRYWQRKLVG